MKTAVADRVG